MSFFCGAISIVMFVTIILAIIPASVIEFRHKKLFSTFPAFRIPLVLIIILFASAYALKVFKKYKVNYLFIFELDPYYRLTHIQLLRVIFVLICVGWYDFAIYMVNVLYAIAVYSEARLHIHKFNRIIRSCGDDNILSNLHSTFLQMLLQKSQILTASDFISYSYFTIWDCEIQTFLFS